jgi:hypothetical protein
LKQSTQNPPATWLHNLFNSGTLYCDHIGIHPYPILWGPPSNAGNANARQMVTDCQNVLNSYSATQVLLITEYSYPATVSDADQKSHADAFCSWSSVLGKHIVWYPAINISTGGNLGLGFSDANGGPYDCRLAIANASWTAFTDRSAFSSFPLPNIGIILP